MCRVARGTNRGLIDTALDRLAVDAFIELLCYLGVTGAAQSGNRFLKSPGVVSLQLMSAAVADLASRSSFVSAGVGYAVDAPCPLACLLCVALGTLGQVHILGMGEGRDPNVTTAAG